MSYFKDAMRAQYYLPIISKHLKPLLDYLYELKQKWVYLDIDEIQKQFLSSLGGEADQILLPVIANELYLAKCSGVLQGNTSAERYDSFF